jgi:hypothetical protein
MALQTFANIHDAAAHVAELVAHDQEPVLQPHEIEDVIRQCRSKDSDGRLVGDDGYVLTVDVYMAASRLWARKAGRAASGYSFSSDNQRFDRSDLIRHCLQMQRHYQSQIVNVWPGPDVQTQKRFELPSEYRD